MIRITLSKITDVVRFKRKKKTTNNKISSFTYTHTIHTDEIKYLESYTRNHVIATNNEQFFKITHFKQTNNRITNDFLNLIKQNAIYQPDQIRENKI